MKDKPRSPRKGEDRPAIRYDQLDYLKRDRWISGSLWEQVPLEELKALFESLTLDPLPDHFERGLPPHFYGQLRKKTPAPKPGPYSPNKIPSGAIFPIVQSSAKYTSYIHVFNRSPYNIDVNYEYRNPSGGLVGNRKITLGPWATNRYSKPNFTGSVRVSGIGDGDALNCMAEIHKKNGTGVALAEPAGGAGYVWFYQLGVKDQGPGGDRTTLATYNIHDTKPIYVEYGLGTTQCVLTKDGKTIKKWVALKSFEVKIPPLGLHVFQPYDKLKQPFEEGRVYVQAMTGPKRTGKQVRYFTGAQFFESTKDIALHYYKRPHHPYASPSNYPTGFRDWYRMYFADVQDDGTTRADRLLLKMNGAAGAKPATKSFPIVFYNQNGKQVSASNQVKLHKAFGDPGSYEVISPMKVLGKAFKGSIWVKGAEEDNVVGWLEGNVHREAPGKWRDKTDYSPPTSPHQGCNCLPYVSNKSSSWIYQIVIFYPEPSLKGAPPAPKDKPSKFYKPSIKAIPTPGGGWVFLTFHDVSGTYKGTYTVKMSSNQTVLLPMNGNIAKYITDFEGSVMIQPKDVIVQLQLMHQSGNSLGSTGNWLSAK